MRIRNTHDETDRKQKVKPMCNCPDKTKFPNACERPCPCDCHKEAK